VSAIEETRISAAFVRRLMRMVLPEKQDIWIHIKQIALLV